MFRVSFTRRTFHRSNGACCSQITCDVCERGLCSTGLRFRIAKFFYMILILLSRRLFRIKYISYTKVVGDWFYENSKSKFCLEMSK